jgi:hypothetical protein
VAADVVLHKQQAVSFEKLNLVQGGETAELSILGKFYVIKCKRISFDTASDSKITFLFTPLFEENR